MLTAQDVPPENPAFAWHEGGGHKLQEMLLEQGWLELLQAGGSFCILWGMHCHGRASVPQLLLLLSICWGREWACHSPCTASSSGTLLCKLFLPYQQLCKLPASKELQACMVEPPGEQPALSVLCGLKAGAPATGSSCSLKMPACILADPSALSRPPFVHVAG